MGDYEKEIAVLQSKMETLETEIKGIKTDSEKKETERDKRFERLEGKLDEALKTIQGRPTWGITVVITTLSGLCTALITFIVTTL